VRELLALLERDYCVAARRVFATGWSNGAFMAYRLACELGDVFAGIAPVSGVLTMPKSLCTPKRPVSVIDFQGTDDPSVLYDGGGGGLGSVPDSIAFFRAANGCDGTSEQVYAKGDATCTRWSACKAGAAVELCSIAGGGHTWPGAQPLPFIGTGKISQDILANDEMFAFFSQHARE